MKSLTCKTRKPLSLYCSVLQIILVYPPCPPPPPPALCREPCPKQRHWETHKQAQSSHEGLLSTIDRTSCPGLIFILWSLELEWVAAFVLVCLLGSANVGALSDMLVCRLDTEYLPSSLAVVWSSSGDGPMMSPTIVKTCRKSYGLGCALFPWVSFCVYESQLGCLIWITSVLTD